MQQIQGIVATVAATAQKNTVRESAPPLQETFNCDRLDKFNVRHVYGYSTRPWIATAVWAVNSIATAS